MPTGINPKKWSTKDYNHVRHLAPEVWNGDDFDERCDIYAVGMTLYRMVNGDVYLPSLNPADIGDAITSGKFPDRRHYREFVTIPIKRIINKAINIDPVKRYQSADEMRSVIEQLKIYLNWNQRKLSNGTEWTGVRKDKYYVLRLLNFNSFYQVEFLKGPSKDKARRSIGNCIYKVGKVEATRFANRVLQDCVLGRIK